MSFFNIVYFRARETTTNLDTHGTETTNLNEQPDIQIQVLTEQLSRMQREQRYSTEQLDTQRRQIQDLTEQLNRMQQLQVNSGQTKNLGSDVISIQVQELPPKE